MWNLMGKSTYPYPQEYTNISKMSECYWLGKMPLDMDDALKANDFSLQEKMFLSTPWQ